MRRNVKVPVSFLRKVLAYSDRERRNDFTAALVEVCGVDWEAPRTELDSLIEDAIDLSAHKLLLALVEAKPEFK